MPYTGTARETAAWNFHKEKDIEPESQAGIQTGHKSQWI